MNFEEAKYDRCKEWIVERLNNNATWEYIKRLGVSEDEVQEQLYELYDDHKWPGDLTPKTWAAFVEHYKEQHPVLVIGEGPDGLTEKKRHDFTEPPANSSWGEYKKSLSGDLSDKSIANIESSCIWTLNQLSTDTRKNGPVRGLVTGSVQSGKTANMTGLVSMAADYKWNFFIILSGTIDNLRKQTRDRFINDLKGAETGIVWKHLDFAGDDKKFKEENLKLSPLNSNTPSVNRYVTVCLKNKTRLKNLIDWLYSDLNVTNKLRIIVIDDEADQASVNTADMSNEDEIERCAINQLIINLVNGKMSDGSTPRECFQAMNYISYTATPYANVLNEAEVESLYPRDFICTLKESDEYFGTRVIFGNDENDEPGLGVVRAVPPADEKIIKKIQKNGCGEIPESMKASLAWFLCSAATLRRRDYKKSISMLIHTSQKQNDHFSIYHVMRGWLGCKKDVLDYCEKTYSEEIEKVTIADLKNANPQYPEYLLEKINYNYPDFSDIKDEIKEMIDEISNIEMSDDKQFSYSEGINVCVDNCGANKWAEDNEYLRIVYPTKDQLKLMKKAPVFIVIGGNTLSRGLTIDGLVCTFFTRTANQADTLMQMARWFGYRKGYELLQRIWMTDKALKKYEVLAKIESDMKVQIREFMDMGKKPAEFGPKIRSIPEIASFLITSKKKSQHAVYVDMDFTGASYETTAFDDDGSQQKNIELSEKVLKKAFEKYGYEKASSAAKGYVCRNVPYSFIETELLNSFTISEHSSLYDSLGSFKAWMKKMNDEDKKYLNWDIAVIDGSDSTTPWRISEGVNVGMISRMKKKSKDTYIDIGALRSGPDVLADVNEEALSSDELLKFQKAVKAKRDLIRQRSNFGLEDVPLLLVYRIKKQTNSVETARKANLNAKSDLIGIAIIVSGDSIGELHAKALQIDDIKEGE